VVPSEGQYSRYARTIRFRVNTGHSRLSARLLSRAVLAATLAFALAAGPGIANSEPSPAPEHLALVKQLGSKDRKEREKAQSVILAIGSSAAPVLLDGLGSDDPTTRGACARLLGKLKVREAKPRLVKALEDRELHVRWMALDALAAMATPRDVSLFARFLAAKPTATDTREGIELLALRRSAAVGLYRADGRKARQLLRSGLKDPEPLIRRTCAFGLGYLKDLRATPDLLEALRDEDAGVREKADLALQWVSGKNVDFEPEGLPLAREAAIERWKQWWGEARENPAADRP